MSKKWYVYIVECSDSSLYTGITTDVERRITEHNKRKKGAWYTKFKRPVILKYIESCENRSVAAKKEHTIKGWTREKKWNLIKGINTSHEMKCSV